VDGGKTWITAPATLQAKTTVSDLAAGTTAQFRYRPVTKVPARGTGARRWFCSANGNRIDHTIVPIRGRQNTEKRTSERFLSDSPWPRRPRDWQRTWVHADANISWTRQAACSIAWRVEKTSLRLPRSTTTLPEVAVVIYGKGCDGKTGEVPAGQVRRGVKKSRSWSAIMRTATLWISCGLIIAACGGQTNRGGPSGSDDGGGGDGAGAGGSGSAPGDGGGDESAGSSGGGSGSSSSGGVSSSSGSSGAVDAGDTCKPLPGCTSTTTCPATDGCNTCTCEEGVWECTGFACPDGGNVNCPGFTLIQDNACLQVGAICDYPLPPGYLCATYACLCSQSQVWYCNQVDCGDSGSLYMEGGIYSVTCPEEQPTQSSSCSLNGALCAYGKCSAGVYATNCLCSNSEWDCATFPGCVRDE
jgi:hypothetical protein